MVVPPNLIKMRSKPPYKYRPKPALWRFLYGHARAAAVGPLLIISKFATARFRYVSIADIKFDPSRHWIMAHTASQTRDSHGILDLIFALRAWVRR